MTDQRTAVTLWRETQVPEYCIPVAVSGLAVRETKRQRSLKEMFLWFVDADVVVHPDCGARSADRF